MGVVASLEAAGVRRVCWVAGKGRASVVLAADTPWGLMAVKARRLDSRRGSLRPEGSALARASRHGASPAPRYYDDNVIVMDYVEGPSLGGLARLGLLEPRHVAEALEAARALDAAGVLHLEIHRPWENVRFTSSGRALIVDLESSSEGCGNVPRLVSGLARLSARLLDEVRRGSLRGYLRMYYEEGCPRSVYDVIKNAVLSLLDSHSLGLRA
jgi:putative serine/threonine protein kinase